MKSFIVEAAPGVMAESKGLTFDSDGKMTKLSLSRSPGYAGLLAGIKDRVRTAQLHAAVSVNRELILLYWDLGRTIVEAQTNHGYGKRIVEQLAADLRREFPGLKGVSALNLWRMRAFFIAYGKKGENSPRSKPAKLSQLVTDSPVAVPVSVVSLAWGHNLLLLHKLKSPKERLWYASRAVEHGWSRAMLAHQIESRLFQREGRAVNNFHRTLPPSQSDLAAQILKDPYNFDFLALQTDAREQELERGLLDHIQKFLLELGVGFAFIGRQYHLVVAGRDYYIDLLFYHVRLRCYVVIDLKMEAFEPEHAGKMNFYLSAADDLLRHADDQPSIGLLLCRERDRVTVEYALRDLTKPIGVARWRIKLVESLPSNLQRCLPTVAEIEAEIGSAPAKKHGG